MCEMITKARKYLENITPIKIDCGLLCGSLCCRKSYENNSDKMNTSEDFGMWLFPGEDILYKNNAKFKVIQADGNNSYPFLLCGYSAARGFFRKGHI